MKLHNVMLSPQLQANSQHKTKNSQTFGCLGCEGIIDLFKNKGLIYQNPRL